MVGWIYSQQGKILSSVKEKEKQKEKQKGKKP